MHPICSRWHQFVVHSALIAMVMGCTHTTEEKKPSVQPPIPEVAKEKRSTPRTDSEPHQAVMPDSAPTPVAPTVSNVATTATNPDANNCKIVASFPDDQPVYLEKSRVFITRLSAPCQTPTGSAGHLPHAGWMAMGFPCTGSEGRIDWKGTNYQAPKMVTFLLDTSCPMAPLDHNALKQAVNTEMGLAPSTHMIAFNPFVVQYWEVLGHDDADASFAVELRSVKSISQGWGKLLKQEPLRVLLVGRENAWVPGNHMYAVDADIVVTSRNRFQLKVISARLLSQEEKNTIKTRCQALRPERECDKVF